MRWSEQRTAVRSTFSDDVRTSTPSDARLRPQSLILFSLGASSLSPIMTFTNFILGYVGNLLATLTGVAISLAIYKLLIPWYRTITYQGVDISGTWTMSANPTH